ncbi:hypothetical protein H6P81_007980 [Aristolochia fimbriata]|uniref:WLM domain-containing protein n=1 Tax=Aristolochia fimbriata TaxID=158543 RepID=A0AAV7F304_ARIFI|nr:hypothetical protein H6P81_007980 [Aristolochia fimbriata]
MAEEQKTLSMSVIWRGKQLLVELDSKSTIKALGYELQRLTNVRPDTMRLLVPHSGKGSGLLIPFSEEHSRLSLQDINVIEGKSIRMMGVFEDEIEAVSINNTKPDLRIIGFDEEERRQRQRQLNKHQASSKLPQGTYIFCDFRTLQIPGIELNPPPLEALRIMHKLASDPGIVAIMNKHRWRVGIMTEMAPEGYVGISPKCLLGFNKNHGEEISLRLRTDDLKGFRKYESIKKTLLHELAHMVYGDHDANFYALDRQLNQEAASLDWTKSKSHTLSGFKRSDDFEEEFHAEGGSGVQKLGGKSSNLYISARDSSVAAAYDRLLNVSKAYEPDPDDFLPGATRVKASMPTNGIHIDLSRNKEHKEPDPDGSLEMKHSAEPNPDDGLDMKQSLEPDPDDGLDKKQSSEPDPDDALSMEQNSEPDPDDSLVDRVGMPGGLSICNEPDPDDSELVKLSEVVNEANSQTVNMVKRAVFHKIQKKLEAQYSSSEKIRPETCDLAFTPARKSVCGYSEPRLGAPDAASTISGTSVEQIDEPDPDDKMEIDSSSYASVSHGFSQPEKQSIEVIEDPVSAICNRLQKAVESIRFEVTPMVAASILQTLFKIIRNVIEHPDDTKFRRLRKANPVFQKNVASCKAAMEVLFIVGFYEDVVIDEIGRSEAYLVLKRNDPGLLWLAKSSLETSVA